jgi:hypothetical protein
VVSKVREKLAGIKQSAQKFDGERFNLRKLNDPKVRKLCHVEITDSFAALGTLSDDEDINRAWEKITDNIKISAQGSLGLYELQQKKPCLNEECLRFFKHRKQAKMQWLKDPKQSNVGDLNNVRREASRRFRNTKKEYLI